MEANYEILEFTPNEATLALVKEAMQFVSSEDTNQQTETEEMLQNPILGVFLEVLIRITAENVDNIQEALKEPIKVKLQERSPT
jgi:hypothetical protein